MPPKKKIPGHLWGAAALLLGGTSYSTYRYVRYHREAAEIVSEDQPSSSGRFEQLSSKYDAAVGAEETWMGVGLLRGWLLNHAKGSVLEISAGTGRNMPYYNYDKVTHLTFTDLSHGMLTQSENKFFEELRLGYKHPDTKVTFALADAHCMVQEPDAPKAGSGLWSWISWGANRTPTSTNHQPTNLPTSSVSTHSSPSHSGSSAVAGPSTAAATEGTAQHPEPPKKKLKELAGDGGSILNIFRVLVPGALENRPKAGALPQHACACAAHDFEGGSWQERCERCTTEDGRPLRKFQPHSFDTVVDTYGLCSHENPVQVLKQAAQLCKPDGRILLLQHGRASWEYWNGHLDDGAEGHKKKWGCWWNRDILSIVRQAGLEVEYVSRWHFGSSYVIIARP